MNSRIDYFKVSVGITRALPDRGMENLEAIREVYRMAVDVSNAKGSWRETTDYHTSEFVNLHYLEAWGVCADWVARLLPQAHRQWELMRVDYRVELPSDTPIKQLSELADGKGRRGHTQHNTRPRTKAEGRERGGFGFYKGSSKSERQVCVYKIETESPCVEVRRKDSSARGIQSKWIQMRAGRWENWRDTHPDMLMEDLYTYCDYETLTDLMLEELEGDIEQECGTTLTAMLEAKWDCLQASRSAAQVFEDFQRLSRADQMNFISELF